MADRNTLGFVGLIFGGITIAVIVTATTVVMAHVEGRAAIDPPPGLAITDVR